MLTLFNALVMSRLNYGYHLCSSYPIKHINMVEKVQRSFTRFIYVMKVLSYPERLTGLKSYSLQHRRERDTLLFMCGLKHLIIWAGIVYHHTLMLDNPCPNHRILGYFFALYELGFFNCDYVCLSVVYEVV